jgi:mevalonate kinase
MTLVETNQHLLRAIGVSHPSLDCVGQLVDEKLLLLDSKDASHATATVAPLAATKLTGAGGGGCAMTLVRPDLSPMQAQDVMQKIVQKLSAYSRQWPWQRPAWRFQCLTSRVGGAGVLWLDTNDFPADENDGRATTPAIAWSHSWSTWVVGTSLIGLAAIAATKQLKR